jgi:hypothetical protein
MRRPSRPTLLAVLASPGDEADPPGGTLVTTAWRGARTVLVTLSGGGDSGLRHAAERVALLFSIESHFLWEPSGEDEALRLARILRAVKPGVVVANAGARGVTEGAWRVAADASVTMPGLPLFDPDTARLWFTTDKGEANAQIDVSAARPLLRAARFLYQPDAPEPEPHGREYFAFQGGCPLQQAQPVTDLFAGLAPGLPEPITSFLPEEP